MAKPKEKFKTYGDVFDAFTLRNIFRLSSQGHFEEDTLQPISIGKEANIFAATRKDGSRVILKIYRLETCDFNKMYDYLRVDPQFESIPQRRRQVIFAWAKREYRNLLKAREVIRVPTPLLCLFNILMLEFIGDGDAAPKLKDAVYADAPAVADAVIDMMAKLHGVGLVHGDLSEFNILYHRDAPVFIDFSQATLLRAPNAHELLVRDVRNVCKYFIRHKIRIDEAEVLARIEAQDPDS